MNLSSDYRQGVTRRLYGPIHRWRLPMLETLIAVAMFVVLGIAVFTISGLDQTA
jgi:hypothetical protein